MTIYDAIENIKNSHPKDFTFQMHFYFTEENKKNFTDENDVWSEPPKLDNNLGGFTMKLTYEQKVQIYHDWKSNRMSASELAKHNKN